MKATARQTGSGVFALSDIHVDYKENMDWLHALSPTKYRDSTLLVGGDISCDLGKLELALACLKIKFSEVFFVPGNHELWIQPKERMDSIAKFQRVLELCASLKIRTNPVKVAATRHNPGVWIVPLFSWYVKPEEGDKSLFVPKENEDPTLKMWADNYFIKWTPEMAGTTLADYFLGINEGRLKPYDAPVISFSHFLPRSELMFNTEAAIQDRPEPARNLDFNFSRVAGSWGLEEQIRRIGSTMHIYGHQHRKRNRIIDGVHYISNCLGYPHEKEYCCISTNGPELIWNEGAPIPPQRIFASEPS